MIFPCVKRANTQIQIHKYAHTAYEEVPERPNMQYILKKELFKGIKKYTSMCQTCKYTNANAQIQMHNYTNTAYHKVPERPNKWHIFEKVIVQGCLLSLAQLYKV